MWLMCTWVMFSTFLYITTADDASCELENVTCECEGKNITYYNIWPLESNIPKEVVSLTITGCNKTKLRESKKEFGVLPDLLVLNLTSNNIQMFASPGSLHHRDMPVLQELILDNNNLTTFVDAYQVFNGLKELEVLSLRNAFWDSRRIINNLTKAFSHSSFESLRELYLDDNDFHTLKPEMLLFDGGKRSVIERLSFRNCSLSYIQKNTFVINTMPELNYIDLSMNRIEELTDLQGFLTSLDRYGSQLSVNLTGNPFYCNCGLEEFRTWLNETDVHIVDKDSLLCHKAENASMTGVPITSLTDELECTKHIPTNLNQMGIPYTILSIIFGIIGLLFIIIMYMRRHEIQTWVFTTGTAIKEVFCSSRTGYSDIGRVQRSEVPTVVAPAEV